jgi:folate-binding protein YgfZ
MSTSTTSGEGSAENFAARRTAAFFDHADSGWIELSGPDAKLFLHNLATNDVQDLSAGQGREIFLTNHKARVVGHGIVGCYRQGDADVLLLEVDPSRKDGVLKHLNHYLISEQVELIDRTGQIARLTLLGPDTAAHVAALTGMTVNDLATWQHLPAQNPLESAWHIRRQGFVTPPGFDLIAPTNQLAPLRSALVERGVKPATPETWETLRIEAGWPAFGHELDENRFVVETGRIEQAISYTKGCYLGQEPIVMARDRGQVNRQLRGLVFDGTAPVPMGTKLMQGEIEIVRVTSSAFSPSLGKAIALAYLYRGHQEPGTVFTFSIDGVVRTATASLLPLE